MISNSQYLLLEIIKASLFDIEPHYPSIIDWNDVVVEAKAQTVMGLISSAIPVQDETSEHCKAMYMRIMFEQDRLIKSFDAARIPCVILKGSSAAAYYPKPYLRTMGDIDVLVPHCKFIESLKVLESSGFAYDHGKGEDDLIPDDIRELVYTKNGICVEIHKRFSSPGFDVDDILEAAIERRSFCVLNGYRFPVLPEFENGLVLLGHINQHLQNNVLGLRQIIDWEMYVHNIEDKTSWYKQFAPLSDGIGLLKLAAYVTRMCYRYLGLPEEVRFEVDVDDSLVDELLEIVLTDGNFGRRVFADKTTDEKRLMSASYNIKQEGFFQYFIRVGRGTSCFFRKHPSLRVLAFIYGFFRLFCKGIIAMVKNKEGGKHLIKGKEMYDIHSKRQELYKKIGVNRGN